MHEALFSDAFTAEGIETIDIAKALIDEGYHPMTMYFPLVVHGAMLIEPTESESKAELDRFCDALESIARRAAQGDETLKGAPYLAQRRSDSDRHFVVVGRALLSRRRNGVPARMGPFSLVRSPGSPSRLRGRRTGRSQPTRLAFSRTRGLACNPHTVQSDRAGR
jgi:hypothetical protein